MEERNDKMESDSRVLHEQRINGGGCSVPEIPVDIVSDEEMTLIDTAISSAVSLFSSTASSSPSPSYSETMISSRTCLSPSLRSNLQIRVCSGLRSCPDVEDSVPSTIIYEDKKKSLLVRFRKKGLWVTDLTRTEWCEKQMEFSLLLGKPKKTVAMKIGCNRHLKLEEEVVQKIKVRIKTNEDVWALKFLNFIQGTHQLLFEGLTRELPVFGLVEGVWFMGVIDELRLSPGDGRPIIVDTKTRVRPCLPRDAQQRNGRMQLMCYKLLWDYLVLNDFPSHLLFDFFNLDPGYVLPEEFTDGITIPLRTLADVVGYFKMTCSSFLSADENLVLRYELQEDHSLISEERFGHDGRWVETEVRRMLEFWGGGRGPAYPPEDERWKCCYCPFVQECIMGVDSER